MKSSQLHLDESENEIHEIREAGAGAGAGEVLDCWCTDGDVIYVGRYLNKRSKGARKKVEKDEEKDDK